MLPLQENPLRNKAHLLPKMRHLLLEIRHLLPKTAMAKPSRSAKSSVPVANVPSVVKAKSSRVTPPTAALAGKKDATGESHFRGHRPFSARGHRPFYARPDKRGSVLLVSLVLLELLVFLEFLVQPRSPLTSNVYNTSRIVQSLTSIS